MGLPKLLITGSSGRIGTILMSQLGDLFELFGVDLCISTPSSNQFMADVSNFEQISNVLSMIAPLPYIVHLAGDPRVDADWQSVLNNNIIGTRNVYEAVKQVSVKRVIFASSNHVTGAYEGFPSSSHTLSNPTHISIQKILLDQIVTMGRVRYLEKRLLGSILRSLRNRVSLSPVRFCSSR